MSPKNSWLRIVKQMVIALAAALAFWAGTAKADEYTWSGGTAGTWSISNANWSVTSGTLWDSISGPSNIANFDTPSLNATVSDTVYTNGILFSAAGILSGGTIHLAGTPPTITTTNDGMISSQISAIAGLIKTGTGTLTLTASQSYSGPTTITGGSLKLVQNRPASGSIGVQFLGKGAAIEENYTTGMFPMAHWNTFSGSSSSTSAPLKDSTGNTVKATLDSFTAPGTWWTKSSNPLLDGYLDNTSIDGTENVTISNIPYASYDVYAYFGSNIDGRTGSVQLDPISGLSVTYFYKTRGKVIDYAQTSDTTGGTNSPAANYAVWRGVAGASFTVNQYYLGGAQNNSGLHGIEIVNATPAPATNFLPTTTALSIDANATLDLSGGSQQVATLSDSRLGGGSIINSNTGTTSVLILSPTSGSTTFSGGILSGGSKGMISLVKTGDGTQVLTGNNTYTGGTTIHGGTLSVGNGDSGASIGTTSGIAMSNNANLTFNHADQVTWSKAITGTGSLTKTGTGTLTLTASQSYNGPTTITGGTLKCQPAIESIGIQFRGSGLNGILSTEIGTKSNGVVPMAHWNTFSGSSLSTSASLNDSNGNTVGAILTSFTASGTWRTKSSTPLLDGYLDNKFIDGIENVTISNIPYSLYDVYAYFGSDVDGRTGSVQLNSGVRYYYKTRGMVIDYAQTLDTTGGTNSQAANYAIWRGVAGASFTVNQFRGSNNSGLHGIEIVNANPTPAINFLPATTALSIDANATLDLSGGSQQVASLSDSSLGGSIINSNTGTTSVLTLCTTSGSTTFSGGILSGGSKGMISLVKAGNGTQVFSGSNTYAGGTTIGGGVLSVGVLANGGSASGIGASGANPANLLLSGGTLEYTGTTTSTDRLFMLGTGTSGIDASGTGPLTLTGGILGHEVAYRGTGARTLVLTGSNTANNTFSLILDDDGAGGVTSLLKDGLGSWTLSGTNYYTGGTTVAAGTLFVTSNTALREGTSLTIGAGGVLIFAPPASGGSPIRGISEAISVIAVPEPGSLALLITGLTVGFALWRCKVGVGVLG